MGLTVAVVGPGRVGCTLAHHWHRAGIELVGFAGRRCPAAEEAVRFAGAGRVLEAPDDLRGVQAVVLAIGDSDLAAAVAAWSPGAEPGSVWLHTSGRHGLEILDPVAERGAVRGALHPVVPIPRPLADEDAIAGQCAVIQGDPEALDVLRSLAAHAGLQPLVLEQCDRLRYHRACALAANGLTALFGSVLAELQGAGLAVDDARRLALTLMGSALARCSRDGPAAALSGPVARGDWETVALHLGLGGAPGVTDLYRALMRNALELAVTRGLDDAAVAALRRLLAPRGKP